MSTSPGGLDDRALAALGALAREGAGQAEAARRGSIDARRGDLGTRHRLSLAIAGERSSPRIPRWRLGLAGMGLAAAVAAGALFMTGDSSLDYAVEGASETAGYVRAGGAPATIRFEDGSSFALAAGASGRVSDVRANGARMALEDGQVEVRITPRPDGDWAVLAGPWEVKVTGTTFLVEWDAREQALRVELKEGKVTVRGPGAEEGVGLRAGQALDARRDEPIHLSSIGSPQAAAVVAPPAAPVDSPAPPSDGSAPALGSAPAPQLDASARVAPPRPWAERVAAGEYDVVLMEAEGRGIDAVLSSASLTDLSALADAARYRGRGAVASRAFTAMRDRFPGSPAAANAAFLLGRMADDGGSPSSAIRWYDAHMNEGGAFFAEALGRKMLAVKRTSGDGAAAAVARQYLARFPKGPHAPAARAIESSTSR